MAVGFTFVRFHIARHEPAPNSVVAIDAARPPKLSKEDRRALSKEAALAVVGGRFPSVVQALDHPEFAAASKQYTHESVAELRQHEMCIATAQGMEKVRKAALQALVLHEDVEIDVQRKDDKDYVAECAQHLVGLAQAGAPLTPAELQAWAALLEMTEKEEKRRLAFLFQVGAWKGVVERAPAGKQVRGMGPLTAQAAAIFGEQAWCERAVKDAVKKGREAAGERQGRRSFPIELEEELVSYISALRRCKVPVYKTSVINYAMRLLSGHEASLNFAKVDAQGEYVRSEGPAGGIKWDMAKLDSWFYRRLLSDRPELTTGAATECAIVCVFSKDSLISIRHPHTAQATNARIVALRQSLFVKHVVKGGVIMRRQ